MIDDEDKGSLKPRMWRKVHPVREIHAPDIQLLVHVRKHTPKHGIVEQLVRELHQDRRLRSRPLGHGGGVGGGAESIDDVQAAGRESVVAQRWVREQLLCSLHILQPGGRVCAGGIGHEQDDGDQTRLEEEVPVFQVLEIKFHVLVWPKRRKQNVQHIPSPQSRADMIIDKIRDGGDGPPCMS